MQPVNPSKGNAQRAPAVSTPSVAKPSLPIRKAQASGQSSTPPMAQQIAGKQDHKFSVPVTGNVKAHAAAVAPKVLVGNFGSNEEAAISKAMQRKPLPIDRPMTQRVPGCSAEKC